MVERWAMIRNGIVENVCLWDGLTETWKPPEGITMVVAPDNVGIGWRFDVISYTWIEPVVEEPVVEEPVQDPAP